MAVIRARSPFSVNERRNCTSLPSRIAAWVPLVVLGVTVFFFSLLIRWHGDAIGFSLFIPAENENFDGWPFTSVWEIFPSMANAYSHTGGRVFSHGIVQFMSAFAGQRIFAFCNAVVWVILAVELLVFSGHRRWTWRESLLTCGLLFLAFFSHGSENRFPFEPPFQIDYVWMSVIALMWLWFWLHPERRGTWVNILSIAFSLMAGLSGEVFNTALGMGLVIWVCIHRFRLTGRQWVMGVVFGAAALFELLCPGNFHRAGTTIGTNPMYIAERLLPALTIPVCWIVARYAAQWRNTSDGLPARGRIIIWTAIITNFAVAIVSGFGSGNRTVSIACVLLILLILSGQGNKKVSLWAAVLVGLAWAGLIGERAHNTILINRQTETIERLYAASDDGLVILPDSLFTYQSSQIILRTNMFMKHQWTIDPGHPYLRLRPASMPRISENADTNILVKIHDQGWIMVQSRRHPARFVIRKTAFPGILDRPMADREFNFAQYPSDVVFDSTASWRAAYYSNSRGYIHSDVTLEHCPR